MKYNHPVVNVSFRVNNCIFHTLDIYQYLYEKSLPEHSHSSNSYEIHYVVSGYGKVKLNDTYYDLKPNTYYVNGPNVLHSQVPLRENPMCEYVVHFTMDSSQHKSSTPKLAPLIDMLQKEPYWIGEATHNLANIMRQIFHEIDHQYFGFEESLMSLLNLLVLFAIRNNMAKDMIEPKIIHTSSVDTKLIIIDNYFLYEYKTLSLEGLSERLSLSPRQTERYLKEHYNKTFIQKKTESKMSTAALLLSNRKNSITYISEELGYSSIEHFSTAFKRYYGCSPSEYRKKI